MKHLLTKNETGERLISFAWILEITFVILGLIVALSISMTALIGDEGSFELTWLELIPLLPGLLIWFAIAFTELIKIPLTQGIMHNKNVLVKIGMTCFLGFICFLTFEAMSTGLDNSASLRLKNVNNKFTEIDALDNQIATLEEQIVVKEPINEEKLKTEAYIAIKPQIEAIDNQIDQLKNQITDLQSSNSINEINELKRQSEYLRVQNDKNLNTIFDLEKLYQNKIEQSYANEKNEIKGVWNKDKIRKKYKQERDLLNAEKAQRIESLQNTITQNEQKILELDATIAALSAIDPETAALISSYTAKIDSLTDEKRSLYTEINASIAMKIKKSQLNSNKVDELLEQKFALEVQKNDVVAALNDSQSDIILTVAKLFSNAENISDLSVESIEQSKMIVVVSLALAVAIIGPLLTFLSMCNFLEETQPKGPNRVFASVRRYFVEARKRLRQPKIVEKIVEKEIEVEVIKEVPVEKIVKEVIEVPTPIEITKYVSVPVPTNPEDLPNIEQAVRQPRVLGGVQ